MLLYIGQPEQAYKETKIAGKLFPESLPIKRLKVEAQTKKHMAPKALALLRKYGFNQNPKENFSLIESVAWSFLLEKEEANESILIPSMIGASISNDAVGINFILQGLYSGNLTVRLFSVRLAQNFSDKEVSKEILEALIRERSWLIRIEMIRTLGAHKYKPALEILYRSLGRSDLTVDEEAALSKAILQIEKEPNFKLIKKHRRSSKAALRNLAVDAYLKAHHGAMKEKIVKLIDDPSLLLREKVVASLTFFHIDEECLASQEKKLKSYAEGSQPRLGLFSAFALLAIDPDYAKKRLKEGMFAADPDTAELAAALWCLGEAENLSEGDSLIGKVPGMTTRMTLAFGMMRNGYYSASVREFLKGYFKTEKDLIMIDDWEGFPVLRVTSSKIRFNYGIAGYPIYVDRLSRLHILNVLASHDAELARTFVKEYLKDEFMGVGIEAMTILLEEGKGSNFDWIRELLHDENEGVRLQAAMCLSIFGGMDDEILNVLIAAYEKKKWEKKIEILQSIAFGCDRKALPFLLDRLGDSSKLIRTIAGAGVLQCLYR